METDLQKLKAYLSGELEGEEAQIVQIFLAAHMNNPEVAALLEGQFDSCRTEDGGDTVKALEITRERLGISHKHRRTGLWLAVAAAIALILALVLFALPAMAAGADDLYFTAVNAARLFQHTVRS